MIRQSIVAVFLTAAVLTAGCRDGATPTPTPDLTAEAATSTPVASATIVRRLPPSPTPTIDPAEQPLAPIENEDLPGLVVPAAAERVEFEAAAKDEDAVATFVVEGVDPDTLYDWFLEQMPLAGWDEGEERDGSLIFLHTEDLSARFAEEGLKRTATVFFDTVEDVEDGSSFTLVVEAPASD